MVEKYTVACWVAALAFAAGRRRIGVEALRVAIAALVSGGGCEMTAVSEPLVSRRRR